MSPFQFSSKLENGIISWVRADTRGNTGPGLKTVAYMPKMFKIVKLPSSILILVAAEEPAGTEWKSTLTLLDGHVLSYSTDIYEIMERAARQYPGYMFGVPWANSFLVAFRGLFDMRMWGFWLALIALAWQAYSEWVR